LCGKCWRGRLCVTSSGDIFPCIMARSTSVGSVALPLRSVLEGRRLTEFRSAVRDAVDAQGNCSPYCAPSCSPGCAPGCSPSCGPSQKPRLGAGHN
jgi:hypothetical protein